MKRKVRRFIELSKEFPKTFFFFLSFTAESSDEKKTETKFNRLAAIRLPFSGILNKFRKNGRSDDIELGGPGGKAGLASMETLDDSTKDPWNQENATDVVDADKPEELPKKDEPEEKKRVSAIISEIRNYNCSLGKFF